MSDQVHLSEVDKDRAAEAAKWWLTEREGWILNRALTVWLAYEANAYWNPEDEDDMALLDEWFENVLNAAREADNE